MSKSRHTPRSIEMDLLRREAENLKVEVREARRKLQLSKAEIEKREKVLQIEIKNKDEQIADLEAELSKLRQPTQQGSPNDVLRRGYGLCFTKDTVEGFNGIVGKQFELEAGDTDYIVFRFVRDSTTNGAYLLLVVLKGEDGWEHDLYRIAGDDVEQLGHVEIKHFIVWLDISATQFGCINYIRNQRLVKHDVTTDDVTEEIEGMAVLSFWSVRSRLPWTLVVTSQGNEYKWWKWTGMKPLQELGTVTCGIIRAMDEDGVFVISSSDDRCSWSLYKLQALKAVQKATWTGSAYFTQLLQSDSLRQHDSLYFVQGELSGSVVVYEYFQGKLNKRYDMQMDFHWRVFLCPFAFDSALWTISLQNKKLILSKTVRNSGEFNESTEASIEGEFIKFEVDFYQRVMVTLERDGVVTLWRQG